MTVYIVTVNGKVSQEAYKTLVEAQTFVMNRTEIPNIISGNYLVAEDINENLYEIHDVRVV